MINFFYREFKGIVSGLSSKGAQIERLKRQVRVWDKLSNINSDITILGDANICISRWDDSTYDRYEMANIVKDYLSRARAEQMVQEITRIGAGPNKSQTQSIIDHVYSTRPNIITNISTEEWISSDHACISLTKLFKFRKEKGGCVRKRVYGKFDTTAFLEEVMLSKINEKVLAAKNLDEAASTF